MDRKAAKSKLVAVLALVAALTLVAGAAAPAWGGAEDVAMFYDSLAPNGAWVDYADYGPVWYPSGVSDDWRPYVNGRWVASPEGWVFETGEPWGWATYHYGNWFPTPEYGWVWNPGRTWYPSTVAWRTSDEYVGWAPIPPPNYVPQPAFYPAGGYYPGAPLVDLLTAPFWIFAGAANFLLGFGQPFIPTYSYYGCGCLAPFGYYPYFWPNTSFLTNCFYPFWAPGAFFFFGPSFPFIARVHHIDIDRFHEFVNRADFRKFHNVLPSREIMDRHPFLRDAVPEAVREGRRFDVRQADFNRVQREIARPNAVAPPRNVPGLKAEIPKALVVPHKETGPEALRGMKGMGLPRGAVKETPQMREQMRRAAPTPKVEAPAKPGFAVPPGVKGEKAVPLPPGLKGPTSEQKMQMEKAAPRREVTPPEVIRPRRAPEAPRPIWTPEELQQQRLQQERSRQRQEQFRQQEQQRLQQPGFREFQGRQQELMRQRQVEPRRAPEFRPAPAPRPEGHPAPAPRGGGGGGGGGHPAGPGPGMPR